MTEASSIPPVSEWNPPAHQIAGAINLHALPESYLKQLPYPYFGKDLVHFEPWYKLNDPNLGKIIARDFRNFRVPFLPDFTVVKDGGLISQIAQTSLFERLWCVRQLGPSGDIPTHNFHSRAEHSLWLTFQALESLNTLYEEQPDQLFKVLRQDFRTANRLSNDKLFEYSTKLFVLGAMYHDAGTYAGGDTIKQVMSHLGQPNAEEDILEKLLLADNHAPFTRPIFADYRQQISQLLSDNKLDPNTDLTYILDCINGRSSSLIGRFINPPKEFGDVLDLDRIAYTLTDWAIAGLSIREEVPIIKPNSFDAQRQNRLIEIVSRMSKTFEYQSNNFYRGELRRGINIASYTDMRFPWNRLSPAPDIYLTETDQIAYRNPVKIASLAYMRSAAFTHYYRGPQNFWLEQNLEHAICQWVSKNGELPECLTPEALLSSTDLDLYEGLNRLPANESIKQLVEYFNLLRASNKITGHHNIAWSYTDQPESEKHAQMRIKAGLDTLVFDKKTNSTITLEEFCARYPDQRMVRAFTQERATYNGKYLNLLN